MLWKSADKLRKNMDAAEYKHVVLGFIYRAEKVFFVPANARWSYLQSRAKLPEIGKDVDVAMEAIEKENATLKGVLPKQYACQNLDKASLGDTASQAQDVLGRGYEYFLGEFAAEGKKGGQFYTPGSIVKVLVNMLEPYKGRVYDPACGSGDMFVQAEKLVDCIADTYHAWRRLGKGVGATCPTNTGDVGHAALCPTYWPGRWNRGWMRGFGRIWRRWDSRCRR